MFLTSLPLVGYSGLAAITKKPHFSQKTREMGLPDLLTQIFLRGQFTDSRIPVAQGCSRPAATSERGGFVLGEGAGLSNVLGSDPDGIAVGNRSAIVAPPVSSRRTDVELVGGETIVGSESAGCSLNAAGSDESIDRSVGGSGEVARVGGSSGAEQSESDDAPACC